MNVSRGQILRIKRALQNHDNLGSTFLFYEWVDRLDIAEDTFHEAWDNGWDYNDQTKLLRKKLEQFCGPLEKFNWDNYL